MNDNKDNDFKKILCYEIKKEKQNASTSIEDFKVILTKTDKFFTRFDKIA